MIRIPSFQYNYNSIYNTKITNVFPKGDNHTLSDNHKPSFKANSLNKKQGIIPFMGLIAGLKGLVNLGTENTKASEKSNLTQEEANKQIIIVFKDKKSKNTFHEYHFPHDFLSNPNVKEIRKQDPAFFEQFCEKFIYNAEDDLDRDINLQSFNGIYRIKQENPLAYNFLISPDSGYDSRAYHVIDGYVDFNLKYNYTEESEKSRQRIKELAKELKLEEDYIEIPLIFAHQKEPEKVEKVMRYLKTTDYNSIALIVGNKGVYSALIEDDPTAF